MSLLRFELKPSCQVNWLPFNTRSVSKHNPNFAKWDMWEEEGFGVYLLTPFGPDQRLYKFPYSTLIAMEFDNAEEDGHVGVPEEVEGAEGAEGTSPGGAEGATRREHPDGTSELGTSGIEPPRRRGRPPGSKNKPR